MKLLTVTILLGSMLTSSLVLAQSSHVAATPSAAAMKPAAPPSVTRVARGMSLGRLKGVEPAMGSVYYDYSQGTVQTVNRTGRIVGVKTKAGDVPANVARVAGSMQLGRYKGDEGAAGSAYYDFRRGYVQVSNVDPYHGKLVQVTTKAGSVPANVVRQAARQNLGPITRIQSAAGMTRYTFARGMIVRPPLGTPRPLQTNTAGAAK